MRNLKDLIKSSMVYVIVYKDRVVLLGWMTLPISEKHYNKWFWPNHATYYTSLESD